MGFCVERGVPHSVFLGRVVGDGEPTWLPEDRAKTVAALLEKAQVCHRCGTARWEWDEDPYAYEPVLEDCIGCLKLRRAEEGSRQELDQPGKSMRLVPKAVAAALRHAPRRPPSRR